jgi:hypothetical protein
VGLFYVLKARKATGMARPVAKHTRGVDLEQITIGDQQGLKPVRPAKPAYFADQTAKNLLFRPVALASVALCQTDRPGSLRLNN